MARSRTQPLATLRYALFPDAQARQSIVRTLAAYEGMLSLLAIIDAEEQLGANLVVLHERTYERLRAATGLPAQFVVLGLRDFVARRAGEAVEGLPLDDKLYATKGPTTLTISTLDGRVTVPFDVLGYRDGWSGAMPARLVMQADELELRVGVTPRLPRREDRSMSSDGILQRMGRLIAGFTHAAIDRAEGLDRVAIVEQAIREIDKAADQARGELGKASAERHRIQSKRGEIEQELVGLKTRIDAALRQGREDLARGGISRSLDLDAQTAALDSALADVDARIEDSRKALAAVAAARSDAEARLRDLKRSEPELAMAASGLSGASPVDRAARSASAIARLTGVPANADDTDRAMLDELERVHREKLIEERLAAFKSNA